MDPASEPDSVRSASTVRCLPSKALVGWLDPDSSPAMSGYDSATASSESVRTLMVRGEP